MRILSWQPEGWFFGRVNDRIQACHFPMPKPTFTAADYLEWEGSQDTRSEFI